MRRKASHRFTVGCNSGYFCGKMTFCALVSAMACLPSCIRDEIPPCQPLQVDLSVKDKNYFNVDKVELEARMPEDLPFRKYVPTLYYRLKRLLPDGSSEFVEGKGVFQVEGDGETYPLTFDNSLPHGTYVLTVWGGINDLAPLSEDCGAISFHPQGGEGQDVYMTNDTLAYDPVSYKYVAELERTKGKLIIQTEGLPEEVGCTETRVDGLFGTLQSHGFRYSDETGVSIRHLGAPGVEGVSKTVLSPSARKEGSLLHVGFYESEVAAKPLFEPDAVAITMNRNSLTVLRCVYEGRGEFSIYILVNDNWERVHGMEID